MFCLPDKFIQFTNPLNPTGRIYTSQQICRGAHGTYVTMMISGSRVKIIPPFRASHEKKTFSDNVTIFFLNASFTREYTKMKVCKA